MKKIALITGAASGIGWETAQLFAEEGYKVIIADLANADDAAEKLGLEHTFYNLDVTNEEAVIQMFQSIDSIDVLVNNAGIGDSHLDTFEQDTNHFRKVIDVHLTGSFLMSREAAKIMRSNKGGSIVNISSIAGVVGLPKRNAYGAAKAGISMMTKSLACEWAKYGIRVNAVAPGYVGTALVKKLIDDGKVDIEAVTKRTPIGRLLNPKEIAQTILFLASSKSSGITGTTIPVDGGWAAFGDFGDASKIDL